MRARLLAEIASKILRERKSGVMRVAIDGVDGSGKTYLANELAIQLRKTGKSIIQASVDGFHNSRSIRYTRGQSSPEGFFRDSYNYSLLISVLLRPLSPGGDLRFRTAAFDHRLDMPVSPPWQTAANDSILLFDGIFLHRPELRDFWDFSIFLNVAFENSIPRGATRGEGSPSIFAPSNNRYIEGQQIYFSECQPRDHASLVIDNNSLEKPF